MYSNVIQLYIFLDFFSITGYYKILSVVPCAIQQVLVGYLFYRRTLIQTGAGKCRSQMKGLDDF